MTISLVLIFHLLSRLIRYNDWKLFIGLVMPTKVHTVTAVVFPESGTDVRAGP